MGLGVVMATLAVASVAFAQPGEVAKAAAEPIMKQLEAFRRDDYDIAYIFASTEVRRMFDREAFERMVKGGYPEIARSTFALVSRTEVTPDGHVYVNGRRVRTVTGRQITGTPSSSDTVTSAAQRRTIRGSWLSQLSVSLISSRPHRPVSLSWPYTVRLPGTPSVSVEVSSVAAAPG